MKKTIILAGALGSLFIFSGCMDAFDEEKKEEEIKISQAMNTPIVEIMEKENMQKNMQENMMKQKIILNLAEIKKHNTPKDCWGVLDGKVYDVTSFFGKHPAGDEKLSKFCGKDATELFKDAHAGKIKPMIKVQQFYKGDFVK